MQGTAAAHADATTDAQSTPQHSPAQCPRNHEALYARHTTIYAIASEPYSLQAAPCVVAHMVQNPPSACSKLPSNNADWAPHAVAMQVARDMRKRKPLGNDTHPPPRSQEEAGPAQPSASTTRPNHVAWVAHSMCWGNALAVQSCTCGSADMLSTAIAGHTGRSRQPLTHQQGHNHNMPSDARWQQPQHGNADRSTCSIRQWCPGRSSINCIAPPSQAQKACRYNRLR